MNRILKTLRVERVVTFKRGIVEIFDLRTLYNHAARLQDIFERKNPVFGALSATVEASYAVAD